MDNKSMITFSLVKDWIRYDYLLRNALILFAIISLISFAIFKTIYPFPNFMPPDSDSYIKAAAENWSINIWPIGYSKFIRLLSTISNSHFFLILIQYVLLQFSIAYILVTLRYLDYLNTFVFKILLLFFAANPLLLHICNLVSSDALFAALTIIWITQLIWILMYPTAWILISHSLILILAFSVRFNGVYYPLISISILAISYAKVKFKLLFTLVLIFPVSLFTINTYKSYEKLINQPLFAAFSGWQIASNALYGYANSELIDPLQIPIKFRELHKVVNHQIDSIRRLPIRPDAEVGIFYFWDFKSPLRLYMSNVWSSDTSATFFKKWASMSPLFSEYGKYLIAQRKVKYIKYFLWPNLLKYYSPPTKFLSTYNMGSNLVDTVCAAWFGWRDRRVFNRFGDNQIVITEMYSILIAICNISFFLLCMLGFIIGLYRTKTTNYKKVMCIFFIIWLFNLVFSVMSAPIEMRYQFPTFIITIVALLVQLEHLIGVVKDKNLSVSYSNS